MQQFRKKPVVIEAIRFDGTVECAEQLRAAFGRDDLQIVLNGRYLNGGDLSIPTLEGEMRASPGDWIIRGVKGELYPCKPDIFEQTYEAVARPTMLPEEPRPIFEVHTTRESRIYPFVLAGFWIVMVLLVAAVAIHLR